MFNCMMFTQSLFYNWLKSHLFFAWLNLIFTFFIDTKNADKLNFIKYWNANKNIQNKIQKKIIHEKSIFFLGDCNFFSTEKNCKKIEIEIESSVCSWILFCEYHAKFCMCGECELGKRVYLKKAIKIVCIVHTHTNTNTIHNASIVIT